MMKSQSVMCHLFQKSCTLTAVYGMLKFSGSLNPRMSAAAVTRFMKPLKLQKSSTA